MIFKFILKFWWFNNNTGQGSSGVCELVYDRDKRVLQVMKIQHLRNAAAKRDFRKEVKMLTRLSSSCVVRIDGQWALVALSLVWKHNQYHQEIICTRQFQFNMI